jgi:hypothetical protein
MGARGPMAQGRRFKGRQFAAEVIPWTVRWYLQFPISYRYLELMLQDRGVLVDHATIFRWIQSYAAELEKRIRPHLRLSDGSWRVDETGSVAISVQADGTLGSRHCKCLLSRRLRAGSMMTSERLGPKTR